MDGTVESDKERRHRPWIVAVIVTIVMTGFTDAAFATCARHVEGEAAKVGPPRPALPEEAARPPEPTPEQMRRLGKIVEDETHLPGPPLPDQKAAEPQPR